MIADDRRRSWTANRRSQAIAEPTVAYISDSRTVKITRALWWRENRSKQYGGRRGGNFAASKFISSFSQPILKFPWHCISPIQKVAFSIASDNDHTQFLCCGIWPAPQPPINIKFLPDFFPAVSLFCFCL